MVIAIAVLHPFGCGDILVLELDNCVAGMHLLIHILVCNELACLAVNSDGSDCCYVMLAARKMLWVRTMKGLLMCLYGWLLFPHQIMKTGPHVSFFITV